MEKNRKMALLLAFTLIIGALPSCKGSEESVCESGKIEDEAIEEVIQEKENGISTSDYDALMTRLSVENSLSTHDGDLEYSQWQTGGFGTLFTKKGRAIENYALR